MRKVRVDVLLVRRGLAESQDAARRMVMAGEVRAAGRVVALPGQKVPEDAAIEVVQGPRFVSRGGDKLEAAFAAFQIDVAGQTCADVGASTGGFTDCLLQHGAERVYAIDVGQGILHWKLRNDPRVVVMEGTNARFLERLPEAVGWVTVDVSFISLKVLLPVIKCWFSASGSLETDAVEKISGEKEVHGEVIALIKPQFEADRREVSRGEGVIRDPEVHRQVLLDVLAFAQVEGYGLAGLVRSPLAGPKGNTEFLAHLVYPQSNQGLWESLVSSVFGQDS